MSLTEPRPALVDSYQHGQDMDSDGGIESKLLIPTVRCLLATRSPGPQ